MAIEERMSSKRKRMGRLDMLMSMKAMVRVGGLGMLRISLTRLPTRSLRKVGGLRCDSSNLEGSKVMMAGCSTTLSVTLSVRSMSCRSTAFTLG